ncbi:hypothetical protein BHE90_002511 [Fusarium euwallaceae]|uniref:Uncharacterized protein n=1 Tax=Fusarium euwallaceae TaxID=1147111 RepID=A0A430M4G4_9HYPO|nr:hypothetical protein BHE90_002511 [Fusarium euwallaceae]
MTASLETEAKEGMGAKGTGEPNRRCAGDREGDPDRDVTGGQPNEDKNDRDTAGQREQDKDQATEGRGSKAYVPFVKMPERPRYGAVGQEVAGGNFSQDRGRGIESVDVQEVWFGAKQNGRSGQPSPEHAALQLEQRASAPKV